VENAILAFGLEQAARLARLSERQLVYWHETGFFSPSGGDPLRRPPSAWLYAFRDVVGLRAISELRRRVPLQHLRKVATVLQEHFDEPWSDLVFYVIDRRVFYRDEQEAIRRADPTGQLAMPFEMIQVVGNVQRDIDRLRVRGEDQVGKIVPMHKRAVLAGTRVPTRAIWEFHQAGYAVEDIRCQYPQLAERDIAAAIAFEGEHLRKTG
jgi:uncharacterized protein (DUF433 family)/DNA-binding transcriptional MerR regulator